LREIANDKEYEADEQSRRLSAFTLAKDSWLGPDACDVVGALSRSLRLRISRVNVVHLERQVHFILQEIPQRTTIKSLCSFAGFSASQTNLVQGPSALLFILAPCSQKHTTFSILRPSPSSSQPNLAPSSDQQTKPRTKSCLPFSRQGNCCRRTCSSSNPSCWLSCK